MSSGIGPIPWSSSMRRTSRSVLPQAAIRLRAEERITPRVYGAILDAAFPGATLPFPVAPSVEPCASTPSLNGRSLYRTHIARPQASST